MAKGIKIGEYLILLRKYKKLSRNQFSRLFNTHVSEVTRWENDTTHLDDKTINKIAEFYDLTYDELISGSFKEKLNIGQKDIESKPKEETIEIKKEETNIKNKKPFKALKIISITTLSLLFVILVLLYVLGYTIDNPLAIALIIFGASTIVFSLYKIIYEILINKIQKYDSKYKLSFYKLNHCFSGHIIALYAMTIILTLVFYLEPVIYQNDLMNIKWFIIFTLIVFITIASLDVYTFAYFYEDNDLDYPDGYIKLFIFVKNVFNMKTLFFLVSGLALLANFILPIFRTSTLNYKLYDFINDYGNGLFYFSMVLIFFSIILAIIVLIKKKILLVPYLFMNFGIIFNTIALWISFNKLNDTSTTYHYAYGYRFLLLILVIFTLLTIIEIYLDLFTLKKRKLEKRK